MKLNLGCGKAIRKGFVNLDMVKADGVDVVHNLESTPLPFKDNSFTYILADNVVEHITNFLPLMKDIHRVSKPEGIVEIIVPHFRSVGAFVDPTHKRFFTSSSFDYFNPASPNYFYIDSSFRVVEKRLRFIFSTPINVRARLYNLLVVPLEFLANLNPSMYDYIASHLLPPNFIVFKLQVVK